MFDIFLLKEVTLHSFCGACVNAFGTAIYARHEYGNGKVKAGKGRVAPISTVSI